MPSKAPERASIDHLFHNLVATCWVYDKGEGSPPELTLAEMPLPSADEYPKEAWAESQKRAKILARLIPSPATPLQTTIFTAQTLEPSDWNNQSPPEEWLRHTAQINAINAFIACDEETADAKIWQNSLAKILRAFQERFTPENADVKHPLAPLVRVMLSRLQTRSLKPSRSKNGIIPNPLQGARALGYLPNNPDIPNPQAGPQQQTMLPKFEGAEGSIVPTGMVYTYLAAGGTIRSRGRGAPLSKRLFYEVLSSLPQEGRSIQGRWELDCTLQDLRDWLYPSHNGKRTNFKMARHLHGIIAALNEVNQMRVRVTPAGHETPTNWLPIAVRALPDANLKSQVLFDINLPPGSSGGALIDREKLRYYGLVSAPRHSAALGMAYYFDKYGTKNGNRVMSTRPLIARNADGLAVDSSGLAILDSRGKPIRDYSNPRLVFLNKAGQRVQRATIAQSRAAAARERNPAITIYPLLTNADILLLCYPEDALTLSATSKRDRLRRARGVILGMQEDGYCVVDAEPSPSGGDRWRLAPGYATP